MADLLTTLPTPAVSCLPPNKPCSSGLCPPIKFTISTTNPCAPSARSYAPASSTNTVPLLLGLRTTTPLSQCCSSTTTLAVAHHHSPNAGMTLLSLFQQLGLNERDLQALLNCNPALALTPFASIQSRVRSLQALGISPLALSRLILKRPGVLTAPEVDILLHFFLGNSDLDIQGKIEPSKVARVLKATEPTFFLGFEDKVRLLLHHGIPQEKLLHVLNNVNITKALCLKSVDEIDRTFAFLNRFGGVDLILKRPSILNSDLDRQLIPRIRFLLDLSGHNEDATATVLRKLPFLVAYSLNHLSDHVEFLKSFAGLTENEIFRIVLVYPNLFSASRRRKLHPRIDFLKQCGLSSQDICRFLIKAPLFIGLSFEENLACKLVFLVKIGYENRTRELAMAMGAVTRTSCKNLQEVIAVFLNYGLTCEDVLEMSKKHPQILQYNHESLKEKLDYLIEDMGRQVGELLAFPAFLGYKLDGRIKQRYEMKKSSGEGMSLNKLLSVSAARFSTRKQDTEDIFG